MSTEYLLRFAALLAVLKCFHCFVRMRCDLAKHVYLPYFEAESAGQGLLRELERQPEEHRQRPCRAERGAAGEVLRN